MKAYTNSENQIVAVRTRPAWDTENTLNEVEIPAENPGDMFYGKCDAFICGYKHGEEECGEDSEGNKLYGIVTTPYKSYEMLEAIQQQYESDNAVREPMLAAAKIAVMSFTDEQALECVALYPEWKSFIGGSLQAGDRVQYEGRLYKVRQEVATVLENQPPSISTAALYEEICEDKAGTEDDPIPYNNNMELFEGKYYSQGGVVYRCTRSTGQPVYHDLSALVGLYVEVA